MGDVMLFGILRMPYNMAMENEISRHQYWQRGQQAADEIERLKGANRAFAEQVTNDYKEIKRLREALKFYANPEHYEYKRGDMNVISNVKWNEIVLDDGKIARSALQQKENE